MLHSISALKPKHPKYQKLKIGIKSICQLIAILLTTSIFLKAIIDIDIHYDPWWYHLPFAARIWGIVPQELFIGDEKWFEPRFDGFPLLAHFLQGFFWRITNRVQSANLVCFFSLIIYFVFLKTCFKIPLYLSAIAIFAIPLVLTHSTSAFVDLPGNVGASVLVMMTYLLYTRKQLPSKRELLILFLGAATAANTKTQLQPLVFFICLFVVARLIWLFFQQPKISTTQLLKILPISLLAATLIFATPVKNIALYGNPFYPVKVEVAGVVLNHKLVPEAYQDGSRPQKWLRSILEINATHWSAEQRHKDPSRDLIGGFFGAYVIFNLLLTLVLSLKELWQNRSLPKAQRSINARTALATVVVMSILPANFPQSHELRYFMFWMISLVSMNLYLISSAERQQKRWRWLQPKYMSLVYVIFLAIVLSKIGMRYAKPSLYVMETQISMGVKPEFLSQIEPNERVCLVSKHRGDPLKAPVAALKWSFLYSSPFHPELDYSYSIQTAFDPQSCGGLKMIPKNIEDLQL